MTAGGQTNQADAVEAAGPSRNPATQDDQQALQQKVSQAIEPIVSNLQDQIAQIARQHVESGERTDGERSDSDASSDVFQQAAGALRETFVLLGKTLRSLLETVRALLTAVGKLLQALITGLAQGLGAIWDSIKGAVRSQVIQSIVDKVKRWVTTLVSRLASWFLPDRLMPQGGQA